jgi:hypothetical protein
MSILDLLIQWEVGGREQVHQDGRVFQAEEWHVQKCRRDMHKWSLGIDMPLPTIFPLA